MKAYISLLRGINVGGKHKIKMDELSALYESLGLENVSTYLQSGNVLFNFSLSDKNKLSTMVEEKIGYYFKTNIIVLIRTYSEMLQIINNNPFPNSKSVDANRLYITFLSEEPSK